MLLSHPSSGYSRLIVDFPTDRNGTLWKRQLKGSTLVSPVWTTCWKADSPKAHECYWLVVLDVGRLSVAGSICTRARHATVSLVSTSRRKSLRQSSGQTCCALAGTSRSSKLRRRSEWLTRSNSESSQKWLNRSHCNRYCTICGRSSPRSRYWSSSWEQRGWLWIRCPALDSGSRTSTLSAKYSWRWGYC